MEPRMLKIVNVFRSSVVLCALVATATSVDAQTPATKLGPLLQPRTSSVMGRSRVIVRGANAASLPMVTFLIRQLGGVPGRQLPILDAIAADVPNTALTALAG